MTELVLEGVLCMTCGCVVEDGEPSGFPRDCALCEEVEEDEEWEL